MKCDKQGRWLKKILTITGMATVLLAPMHLEAQSAPDRYSPTVMAMLPEYCKYTQGYRERVEGGNDPEKIKQWYSIFGGSPGEGLFHAMHHYCNGLTEVYSARFWARSKEYRAFHLGNSISEFDYVIGHSRPGEKMLPEFHTKKGESLLALDRAPLASVEFEHAIELKPDYWPPYAAMSDYYKGAGDLNKAREVLQRGLSASPDANALKRRLAELDAVKNTRKAAPSRREPVSPPTPDGN